MRGKTFLGSLCFSVVCMCVIAVSSASADRIHECKKVSPGGTGDTAKRYTSAECETENASSGEFRTVPVAANTPLTPTATSNFTIATPFFGINFVTTCTGVTSSNTVATNGESGGSTFASGTGKLSFTGCSVTAPAGRGCTVPSTITTSELNFKTDASGNIKYEPSAGEVFVTIPVSGCSAEALNGNKEVKGTGQSTRKSAPTQEFSAASGSKLTFAGQVSTLSGSYHFKGPNGGKIGVEGP